MHIRESENVIIFRDTEKMCNENKRLKDSVMRSKRSQKLILDGEKLSDINRSRYEEMANIIVSKKRTLEAAAAYKDMKVAVHNFASATNPGGGVTKGATAQEEWYEVDVITCAAPNLREKPSNQFNKNDGRKRVTLSDTELLELHENRLRKILDVAVLENVDTIILGAFGCGAFQNKPETVARAASTVIKII